MINLLFAKSNSIKFLLLSGLISSSIHCKKTVQNPLKPFTIQTHQFNGVNTIWRVFALDDNTFIISTQNRGVHNTRLFRYAPDLKLIDSATLPGFDYAEPVIQGNHTFVMAGSSDIWYDDFWVKQINNDLKVERTRKINTIIPWQTGWTPYPIRLAKLTNGSYVFGLSWENYPTDKLVLFAVKDPFTSTKVLWKIVPTGPDKKWIEKMSADDNNQFYVSSTDHLSNTANFLNKYDSSGKQLFETLLPQQINGAPLYLKIEKDRFIFNDYAYLNILDNNGTLLSSQPIDNGYIRNSSAVISKNNHYYFLRDVTTADGKYVQVCKTDMQLKVIKTANFGNRGTNLNEIYSEPRNLIMLSSGDMVLVSSVENTSGSGTNWLLLKFDENLEIIK